MHLNPKAAGQALGTLAAIVWIVIMGLSLVSGFADETVRTFGKFHPFFTYSWGGLVVMAVEHVIAGYVAGWLFAKLYNNFLKQKQGN